MAHARKQIRDAVKQILDENSSARWNAVLATRIAPTRVVWPFLLVFSDGEPNVVTTIQSPTVHERDMSLSIVAAVRISQDKENVEDAMDDICKDIEETLTTAALHAKLTLKNIILELTSSEFTVIVDDEDRVDHAEVLMNWSIRYYTNEGLPEVLL